MSVDDIVRRYVLDNAIHHNGRAVSKSVLSKILGDHPELRRNVLEVRYKVDREVERVNRMSPAAQHKELEKLGGVEKKAVKPDKHELSELIGAKPGHFVVRMAPNPNGALTLGHARPAILNYEYAKKYKGKFILRFDDTDPKNKTPEKIFYKMIQEDLKWLGIKWDKLLIASKRLKTYYKYAEKLIKMGKAYVCTCKPETWKWLRNKSEPCPCRNQAPRTHALRWKKMLAKDGYMEGEAVVRIKTDLKATNPALRDWPALRIINLDNQHHPLKKAKVWPLLDFQSAIDDHLTGVTHILRGNDLITSEKRQRYLYQHFGWIYPQTSTVGKFSLSGVVLSKSKIKEGIKTGKYRGWDDTALGTIRSLKRKGFQAQAIRQLILDIGHKSADITVSMKNLAAYNRKIIDPKADRYFFISDPVEIKVKNPLIKTKKIPLHPNKNRGSRSFRISGTFFVEKKDFDKYRGLEVRLKDLFNIKLEKETEATGTELKPIPKIQWVTDKHISVRVLMEEKMISGYGEQNLRKTKLGQIIQFERFGFVRVEKKQKSGIVVVFAHE